MQLHLQSLWGHFCIMLYNVYNVSMEYNPHQSRSKGPLKGHCCMRQSRKGVKTSLYVILAVLEAEEVFISSHKPWANNDMRLEHHFSGKHKN